MQSLLAASVAAYSPLMRYFACTVAMLLAVGCGGESIVISDGVACMFDEDDGDAMRLQVSFDGCEPCAKFEDESCTVVVDGNVITVSASRTYERSAEGTCTAMCRGMTTECDPLELAEGTYELRFGGKSVPVTVPAGDGTACVGNHPAFD